MALIAILMLAGLAPAALPGSAQDTGDVPMFRGNPARTGEMPGPGPEGEISVLWQWSGDEGDEVTSSPAVVDGVVYVGIGHDAVEPSTVTPDSSYGYVIALDSAERMELWRFSTGDDVRSSPAVVDGVVYVGSWDDNVYAIDAATGSERWRFATGSGVTSSPAVVDGVVYVGSRDKNVYAIDAATGSERWRFGTGFRVFSSPAVVDGVVYVGSLDNKVYAIDAATGRERWRFATGGSVLSSPAVVDGVVYVGSMDDNVYAIDAATGRERWRFATGGSVLSSPAVVDGVVYIGSFDDNVYAIDAATGSERWRFATGGWVTSSPAVVDGVVYVGSNDGSVYALANPATREVTNAYQQYWTDTAFNLGWLAENSSDVPRGLTIGAGGRSADDPRLPWNAAAGRTWAVTLGRGGSGEAAVSALAYDDAAVAASEAQVALDGLTRQGWTTAETDRVADGDTCLTYRDAGGAQAVCYAVRGRLVIVGVSALPVDNVDAALMNAADLVRLGVAATQDLTLPG